jgi:tRNA(Ile2) C34 agmatinyltransferase TiaS
MTKKVQIDLREPVCPSCEAILEKVGEIQQEGYILLELACKECKRQYRESDVKNFETE